MSTSTSSAIPNDLNTYSRIALTLDGDIAADAGRLAGVISRFESTCREADFRVPAGHMPPVMSRFARDAEPTDRWVNTVAGGFLAADSGGLHARIVPPGPRVSLIPPGAGWLPWPPPSWLPIISDPDEGGTRVTPLPIVTHPLEPAVSVVEWKRPAWLFVPAWIWMLLPIRIWEQLPWFAALGAIFGFRPITRSLPWPSRLWRPVVDWFPHMSWNGFPGLGEKRGPDVRDGEHSDDEERLEQTDADKAEQPKSQFRSLVELQTPATQEEIEAEVKKSSGRLPYDDEREQCVAWVQNRVEKLTGKRPPNIGKYSTDVGAQNYRYMFDGVKQFKDGNWSEMLAGTHTGSILVWTSEQVDNNGYGHVAVVEHVSIDGIWISQANWPGAPITFMSKKDLESKGLYLVPEGSPTASVEEFAARKTEALNL